jgi:hypothetical protein
MRLIAPFSTPALKRLPSSSSAAEEDTAAMASPMVEGRVDPHKKAHFTLHISDAIADGEVGDYTSVKCNTRPMSLPTSRPVSLATSALLT